MASAKKGPRQCVCEQGMYRHPVEDDGGRKAAARADVQTRPAEASDIRTSCTQSLHTAESAAPFHSQVLGEDCFLSSHAGKDGFDGQEPSRPELVVEFRLNISLE